MTSIELPLETVPRPINVEGSWPSFLSAPPFENDHTHKLDRVQVHSVTLKPPWVRI